MTDILKKINEGYYETKVEYPVKVCLSEVYNHFVDLIELIKD